jgi:hypothetical protein
VTLGLDLVPEEERAHLVGKVVRPDGDPASGATVLLAGSCTLTDDAGAFELVPACDPAGAELVVVEPGFGPLVVPDFGSGLVGGGIHAAGSLRLPGPGLTLAGRVRRASGAPLADVEVELLDDMEVDCLDDSVERTAAGYAPGQPRTDGEGRFEVRGLLPAEYRLRIGGRHFGRFRAGTAGLWLVVDER